VLKARGRAISNACVVAERLKNDYVRELEYEDIRIFTERIKNEKTGRVTRVTSIEIVLSMKSAAA